MGIGEAAVVLAVLANLVLANSGGLSGIGLGRQMTVSAAAIDDARSAAFLIALAFLLLVSGVAIDGMSDPVA